MKAICGQKLVPGYADKYLAQFGYDGQETNEPVPPDRPDNLFDSVPGDYSAHGIFDSRAKDSSPLTWMELHRGFLGAGAAAVAIAGALVFRAAKGRTLS